MVVAHAGRYAPRMIRPEQSKAARALLGWNQEQLAARANIGSATVQNFESGKSRPNAGTLRLIKETLEAAGIRFVDNGEYGVLRRDAD